MDYVQIALSAVTAGVLLWTASILLKQSRFTKATAESQKQAVEIQAETAKVNKYLFVYSLLQDETVRNDRETIFKAREKPATQCSIGEVKAAERICQKYDFAVMMVNNGLLEGDILEEKFGEPIRRLWPILKPLIMQSREERGDSELWKGLWNFMDKLEHPSK